MKMNFIWSEPASGCRVMVLSTAPVLWLMGSRRWTGWAKWPMTWFGVKQPDVCWVTVSARWETLSFGQWTTSDPWSQWTWFGVNRPSVCWIGVSKMHSVDWQMIGNNSRVPLFSLGKLGDNNFASKPLIQRNSSAKKAKTVTDSGAFQYDWVNRKWHIKWVIPEKST